MLARGLRAIEATSQPHLPTPARRQFLQPSRATPLPHCVSRYSANSSTSLKYPSDKRREGEDQAARGAHHLWYTRGKDQHTGSRFLLVFVVCGGLVLASAYSRVAFADTPHSNPVGLITTLLPRTPAYSEMPIQAGHLGNLTAEQEAKLRSLWAITLKTFGVTDANAANGAEKETAATGESADSVLMANPEKEKKKKRMSMFSRKHDKEKASSGVDSGASSPGLSATDDDKYGQAKEFHDIIEKQTPEELRTAFWTMVKCDHPDALLLRFLRARKWDVEKALIMLISTMRWRSAEMLVDGDIIKRGDGGAQEDSKSSDNAVKKEGEDFLDQLRLGKSFLHGIDKEGRPLCIVRVRLHKPGEQTEKSMERYTVYVIETARLVLRPPVDTAVSYGSISAHFQLTWSSVSSSTCLTSVCPTWTIRR
jgi:CRAL/TRIO, N-terminal domain/CRAL/TRIO domain